MEEPGSRGRAVARTGHRAPSQSQVDTFVSSGALFLGLKCREESWTFIRERVKRKLCIFDVSDTPPKCFEQLKGEYLSCGLLLYFNVINQFLNGFKETYVKCMCILMQWNEFKMHMKWLNNVLFKVDYWSFIRWISRAIRWHFSRCIISHLLVKACLESNQPLTIRRLLIYLGLHGWWFLHISLFTISTVICYND